MSYLIALAVLLLVVPVLFMLLSRRGTTGSGFSPGTHDRGVTVAGPSADQPTPRSDAVNRTEAGAERKIPPG